MFRNWFMFINTINKMKNNAETYNNKKRTKIAKKNLQKSNSNFYL